MWIITGFGISVKALITLAAPFTFTLGGLIGIILGAANLAYFYREVRCMDSWDIYTKLAIIVGLISIAVSGVLIWLVIKD